MLGGIRAAQSTWIGKALTTVVFAFIVLAFVIWGVGDVFRGIRSNSVAQVGGETVSTAAFRQAYGTELQSLQQRAKRPITNEEAHRFGLDTQVLSRLVSEAALDGRARGLDLAISDGQVAKAIVADPSFAGPGGGFDRGRFNSVLRENGFTEASFVIEQRRTVLRRQLLGALIGDLAAPTAAVEALHRYSDETRSLDYLALPAAAAGAVATPDDAALQGYYDAHKTAFTAPQYRKLVALGVTPAGVAQPGAVSDDDAQALYDRVRGERFGSPEKRHVEQIVFPAEADAAAFVARLRSGTGFAEAVKAESLGDRVVDLGTVPRGGLFEGAVADAAFALPADGTSDPVKGSFGSVVVHVDAVEPAATRPFAEVEAELKAEIATTRGAAQAKALRDRIEDARSSGKTLTEAAASVGQETRTVEAVDAVGTGRDGRPVEGLVGGPALLKAAFASDVGVDNDTIPTADGGTVWFEVAGIDPARQLTLAEARPAVEAAWREEQTARQLDALSASLVRDIDAGRQTLEGAAKGLGDLPVQHVADAKRAGARGFPPGAVAEVFDVSVGAAGSVPTGPMSRLLFKVLDSVTPPLDRDAPATRTSGERYGASLGDEVVDDYLGVLRARLGVKVDQSAVQAASGAGS